MITPQQIVNYTICYFDEDHGKDGMETQEVSGSRRPV